MKPDELYSAHVRDFGKPWADHFKYVTERYEEIKHLKEVLFSEANPIVTSRSTYSVSGVLRDETLTQNDYILLANGGPSPLGGSISYTSPTTLTVIVHTD